MPSFCHKFQLLFYPYAEGYCFKILQDFPSDIVLPIRKGISRAPMCVSLSGTWFLHAQRISLQKFSAISSWDTRPLRRCYHPAAIFQQSRAEVGPNSYARGDHIRPCYIGQRSAKREPCIIGKRTVSPGRFFRMDCRSRPWVYRITERIFPTSRDCRFVELVFPLCVKDVDRSTP